MDELEQLVNEAVAAAKLERKQKELRRLKHSAENPGAPDIKQLYQNPDNWERTRGIALIHADTQTLLGNYSEYVHRTVPNCRRLVREETPITVVASETVEGSWWLDDTRRPEPQQEWHVRRPAIVHLHFPLLAVHSPACEVIACLSYGGLTRVELVEDTQFAQEDGKKEQHLWLPKGTNVIGEMSLDCKIALRVALGQELA